MKNNHASRPTIWVDVSTLLNWQNLRAGIPRAMKGILLDWMKAGYTNLRYCEIRSEPHGFYEVSLEQVRRLLDSPKSSEPPLPAAPAPKMGWKQRLRIWIPNWARPPLRWLRRGLRRLTTRQAPALPPSPAGPVVLRPGDLWICLGGNWDLPGSAELCQRLKEQMGFQAVFMIHDVIPFKVPQFVSADYAPRAVQWLAGSASTADLLVTSSNYSRQELIDFCSQKAIPCPPLEVVRLGEDLDPGAVGPDDSSIPDLGLRERFALCVGALEVRKNQLLLYHVWRRLLEDHGSATPKLVLVGRQGWLSESMFHQLRCDLLTHDHIIVLTDVNDSQLAWLYQNCLITVYPSFYEGWGLPVGESLCFGKYCVASNTSSLPEIGGNLVGSHDPYDWKACLEMVRRALFDEDFRTQREQEIHRRHQRTSWSQCANQLRQHIEKRFGPVFSAGRPRQAAGSLLGRAASLVARRRRAA